MPPPGDGSGGRREGVRMRFKRAGLLTKVVVMVLLIYMATALLDLHGQIQTIQVEREELNQQVAAQQLENRLGEVMDDLLRQKGEYAMAWEQSRELYSRIDPIVNHEEDLSISGGDCLNLRDYLEAEGKAAGLLQGALYRQGFRDCVQALHLLGVLGMRTAS